MKISLDWLNNYVSCSIAAEKLADRLTMIGFEVENIYQNPSSFQGIVVGKILDIKKHPYADKLNICSVDIGKEKLSIVCGAQNVRKGQHVPVALKGSRLAYGVKIKTAKIRGVQSEGMICSEKELGLGEDQNGILVLDSKTNIIGKPFKNLKSIGDTVLDIDVTPNRPDCLSHIGIAREVGLILGEKVSRPDTTFVENGIPVNEDLQIEITDIGSCPRYSARVIRDLTIDNSPGWLKLALESVGLRSINNIVDITNFILMETGHPLHAFDYDLIQGKKIVVRKAAAEEEFSTLDNQMHKLSADDLLICDSERGVALAGIMGGLNSEVSEHTHNIVLESAYFDPMTIRKTSKKLGIYTEASQRFERGTDPENTIYTINRAAKLISEIAGGTVDIGIIDIYPNPIKSWKVPLRFSRISKILGVEIPRSKVISILNDLELKTSNGDPIHVTIPTFRQDLKREIDLIEEIVRHYGFENIDPKFNASISIESFTNFESEFSENLRDILVGLGYVETLNNSMVSKTHISLFASDASSVTVKNPISPETGFLRTSLIPGLLDSIQRNQNHGTSNLKLFEIGRCFYPVSESLPEENLFLVGAITGLTRSEPFWAEKDEILNLFHIKGTVETLFDRLHIKTMNFQSSQYPVLRSENCQYICSGKNQIGFIGELKRSILEKWDIKNNVFVFEIPVRRLQEMLPDRINYTPIPRFPPVKRDLAIVIEENIPVGSIESFINKNGGKDLISVKLFDLYRGKQILTGEKSVAFSLTFQSPTGTLKEVDIDPVINLLIKKLQDSFSAKLRS